MRSALFLALALTGSAALAEEAAPTADDLVALIEENGCSMEEADAEALLSPHGFTPENVAPLVDALIADGRASLDGAVLTVKTEACP